ncbi:hypothetical protein, partial [Streptomyces sp. JV190]|uniref:hypothetical protein n=1 Tax=Streptomyces sp. JV190 TaxID=3002533 RepID=UPI002E79DCF4
MEAGLADPQYTPGAGTTGDGRTCLSRDGTRTRAAVAQNNRPTAAVSPSPTAPRIVAFPDTSAIGSTVTITGSGKGRRICALLRIRGTRRAEACT